MGDKSKIEWTDATWNPVVGCSIVSPGCANCYAMAMAGRLQKINRTGGSGSAYINHYDGTTQETAKGKHVWTGKVALAREHILTAPLRWHKPRRIFVNSMGDLFHESVPDEWIDKVFAVMALAPQHTFQVLTKRAGRMRDYVGDLHPGSARVIATRTATAPFMSLAGNPTSPIRFPLPNVWLGVSVEDQARADERIPDLLATPAAIRWVSAEPLLGPINLRRIRIAPDHHTIIDALDGYAIADAISGSGQERTSLDWIVAGGESGPGARPAHPDWFRSIRDRCKAAGVAFLFKQWGEWLPDRMLDNLVKRGCLMGADGTVLRADEETVEAIARGVFDFTGWQHFSAVGKQAAGRLLDGVMHDEYPAR